MKDKFKLIEVPGDRDSLYQDFESKFISGIQSLPEVEFKYLNFYFKSYVLTFKREYKAIDDPLILNDNSFFHMSMYVPNKYESVIDYLKLSYQSKRKLNNLTYSYCGEAGSIPYFDVIRIFRCVEKNEKEYTFLKIQYQ